MQSMQFLENSSSAKLKPCENWFIYDMSASTNFA